MNLKQTFLFVGCLFLMIPYSVFSQDAFDLLDEEEEDVRIEKDYTIATFKGTRLINFHTIETPGKNALDYRISHRFGTVNSGIGNFYGLDGGATIRMGIDYSRDGRLAFGIGRTNVDKTVDGYVKFRIIRQTTDTATPLSVTLVSSVFCTTQKDGAAFVNGFDRYEFFTSRLAFAHQLLIASKFSERFSLQIAPMVIHQNLVEKRADQNTMFAATGLGRFKITKRLAITGEYGMMLDTYHSQTHYPVAGMGLDIETGGHVFQVHVTNATGMLENQFMPYTSDSWSNGGVRIGFNISRVFGLNPRPKKKPEDELTPIPVVPNAPAPTTPLDKK